MKKLVYLLVALLVLVGCSSDKTNQENIVEEEKHYSILCPSGAPAMVFYNKLDGFDVADAGAIKTQVLSEDGPDFCALPTNVAITLLEKGIDYKLVMFITYGNFFVCATGKDDDANMDAGDKIVLFSEGSLPDLLFHYVYGDGFNEGITYVNDASDALRELVSETSEAEYVLLAEPSLTIAFSKNKDAYVYENLQQAYKDLSLTKIFQASLLVKNSVEHDDVVEFVESLKGDIDALLENPDIMKTKIEEAGLSDELAQAMFGNIDADIAALSNNNTVGIGYNNAVEDKSAIDKFISLFGMGETSEEIYFQ
ncbi:MAG: hypothetical protein Q4E33_03740 [Erysipelotrichaceae bacterium]|nr:hypothetical protein [Erysipelotrichaceae bacterium]